MPKTLGEVPSKLSEFHPLRVSVRIHFVLSAARSSPGGQKPRQQSFTLNGEVKSILPPELVCRKFCRAETRSRHRTLPVLLPFVSSLSSLPCLNLQKNLLESRRSQGRILWCKEAVSVRQMAFHIPWGTVSKQPTQMYNFGTNMNHQADTSPSHSKISGQTSQYIPQIPRGRRGVGRRKTGRT